MRHSTARISAAGAQRKRSQLLCEAKFISAARRFTPNRIHVPHRAKAGGSGETWDPARPRMISAASIQTPTANALAMRSLTGSRAWIPPQAARPSRAPSARAAWKAAMARKPAAAATAGVIGVLISAFFAWLTQLTSRPRAHVYDPAAQSDQGRTSPSARAGCPAGPRDIPAVAVFPGGQTAAPPGSAPARHQVDRVGRVVCQARCGAVGRVGQLDELRDRLCGLLGRSQHRSPPDLARAAVSPVMGDAGDRLPGEAEPARGITAP